MFSIFWLSLWFDSMSRRSKPVSGLASLIFLGRSISRSWIAGSPQVQEGSARFFRRVGTSPLMGMSGWFSRVPSSCMMR